MAGCVTRSISASSVIRRGPPSRSVASSETEVRLSSEVWLRSSLKSRARRGASSAASSALSVDGWRRGWDT